MFDMGANPDIYYVYTQERGGEPQWLRVTLQKLLRWPSPNGGHSSRSFLYVTGLVPTASGIDTLANTQTRPKTLRSTALLVSYERIEPLTRNRHTNDPS